MFLHRATRTAAAAARDARLGARDGACRPGVGLARGRRGAARASRSATTRTPAASTAASTSPSATRTSFRAPAAGEVTFAGTVPTHGLTVTIATAGGYKASLTHLGALLVQRGAVVAEGDPIAEPGPSGTPEHDVPYVHLGIRTADDAYVDPLSLLPPRVATTPPPAPVAPPAPVPTPPEPAPPRAAVAAPPVAVAAGRSRRRRLPLRRSGAALLRCRRRGASSRPRRSSERAPRARGDGASAHARRTRARLDARLSLSRAQVAESRELAPRARVPEPVSSASSARGEDRRGAAQSARRRAVPRTVRAPPVAPARPRAESRATRPCELRW